MDVGDKKGGTNANYHTETHAEVTLKAWNEDPVKHAENARFAHGFFMFRWGAIFGGLVVHICSVCNSR